MTHKSKPFALVAGLLFCAGAATSIQAASTFLVFSVDLSANVLPVTSVECRGTFNGYSGGFVLTNNPLAANPNLYSGTIEDTLDPNGGKVAYKFVINPGPNWENTASGQDRASRLPATPGATLVLPTPFFGDAGAPVDSDVKFQVDVSQQIALGNFIPGTSSVEVRGSFQGWTGGSTLEWDPTVMRTNQFGLVTTNVYTNTFTVTASPAATAAFKYVIQPGTQWEGPSAVNGQGGDNNRYFANIPQTLPVVDFGDAPFAPIAQITFNVDMSAVLLSDPAFDPNSVTIYGDFNGWSAGVALTNNPSAANTNIYSGVVSIGSGATINYQFRYSNGSTQYDHAPNGGNRQYLVPNVASANVPAVFFNNILVSDLLTTDTLVTFTVNMTNAVGTDTHAFDLAVDGVYINGDFMNWNGGNWDITLPSLNNPNGDQLFTFQTTLAKGHARRVQYKYSINGGDNEAPSGQDHVRFVRSSDGVYQMPVDKFGTQTVESKFGNLSIGAIAAGHLPVTWLGYPSVRLQVSTNLNGGTWQDIPATDGLSATNWPLSGGSLFFRLVQP